MNPLFYLLLAVIPLAVLARVRGAYPSRRLVLVALGPAAASFLLLLAPGLWPLVLVVDLAAMIAVVADLVTIPSVKTFAIERQALRIASLQKPHRVEISVLNRSDMDHVAWLRDGYPTAF